MLKPMLILDHIHSRLTTYVGIQEVWHLHMHTSCQHRHFLILEVGVGEVQEAKFLFRDVTQITSISATPG